MLGERRVAETLSRLRRLRRHIQGTKIKNLKVAVLDMYIAKRKLKQSKGDVKTRKSGCHNSKHRYNGRWFPIAFKFPKTVIATMMMVVMMTMLWCRKLEVILRIELILTKSMIKLKTKAKQLWRRRALPHFYIPQDLVEFAGHGRGEQALWIFHDGAGNFKVSI